MVIAKNGKSITVAGVTFDTSAEAKTTGITYTFMEGNPTDMSAYKTLNVTWTIGKADSVLVTLTAQDILIAAEPFTKE